MKKHSSSLGFMSLNSDAVHEILLRVDPSSIFDCILVSKDWLQVIAGPSFRRHYLATWNFLVGFIVYESLSLRAIPEAENSYYQYHSPLLLPASKLGIIINQRKSLQCIGDFISNKGGLMLSADTNSRALYVSNIASAAAQPLLLPRPDLVCLHRHVASILSCEEGFKVILARDGQANHVCIQTYCSWTRKWEQSTLTCSKQIKLGTSSFSSMYIIAGMMTNGGVVYWKAKASNNVYGVAVYDSANLINEVIFIPGPYSVGYFPCHYGLSPRGSLWCATWKFDHNWGMMISIWGLDDDDNKGWKMLYGLDINSIWMENSAILAPIFETRPKFPFEFLSFFPGRSGSIHLKLGDEIFEYHLDTQELERIEFEEHYKLLPFGHTSYLPLTMEDSGVWPLVRKIYHPLTMEDLGVWPSSPSVCD